jgi:flavin reductase (DIM6/NTAB) family NADH-FMN oxidoreductase RutF
MECRLVRTLDFPPYDLFVGEVVQTHGDEDVLTDGRVDFAKVKPMLFDMPSSHYWRLGAPFSKCWDVGRSLKR